jgi:Asp-tRNA(Asn)/Glu-tRNA(Gln) amidotransferase C subunit
MATTDGSSRTMPLSRTKISVLAVPRSIARSVENTDGMLQTSKSSRVPPALRLALRLREDQVSEPDQREANQRSAPAVERGLFLVPKVIE